MRQEKSIVIMAGLIAMSLAACASAPPSTGASSPSAAITATRIARPPWQIDFTLSGGIAGVMRSLSMSSTGALAVADERSGKRISKQLADTEVTEIELLLANSRAGRDVGRPPQCADCFQYDLSAQWQGERFNVRLNDRNLPGSSLEPLVAALMSLLERTLAGK